MKSATAQVKRKKEKEGKRKGTYERSVQIKVHREQSSVLTDLNDLCS